MPVSPPITRLFDLLEIIASRPGEQIMFSSICNGQWREYSVSDYLAYANRTADSLISYGTTLGEPVISITQNRAEFNFADMGILQAGAVHVPLYPGIDEKKLSSILDETGARIVFISNRSILRKLRQIPGCKLQLIVSFDKTEGAVFYEDFLKQGTGNIETLEKRKKAVAPDDAASIIYLSGSNTPLQGVVLTHNNHIFNLLNYNKSHHMHGCGHSISFLPLAHSFERTVNYSFQYLGIKVSYSEGIASLPGILKQKNPDVMLAVPLVLERIIENTRAEILKMHGLGGGLARFVLYLATKEKAGPSKRILSLKKILFKLGFKRLRNFLGGNIKVMLCGGAALKPETLNILWAAGIKTYEGYGLTEAGPLVSYNLISAFKSQSVGKLMPGVEVRIAPDQEILVKSGGIMKGYFMHNQSPVDTKGWLHTGDLGSLDEEGFLTLTGIKKEIFKLSSGLYTDPRPIETLLVHKPGLRNVWVYGHNRISLTAVILPENEKATSSVLRLGSDSKSYKTEKEAIINQIKRSIETYNSDCAKYEQIVKYEITDDVWTVENGLLNDDKTLNRPALFNKYQAVIEKMYS